MWNHPAVIVALQFLAGFTAMALLHRMEPLGLLVWLASGLFATVIWLLRFEPARAQALARHPWGAQLVRFVCQLSREPLPAVVPAPAAAPSATVPQQRTSWPEPRPAPVTQPESPFLLSRDVDFAAAARQLRAAVRGHDSAIGELLEQLRYTLRLRQSAAPSRSLPPLGFYLLAGQAGIGKRTLASAFSPILHRAGAVTVFDTSQEIPADRLLADALRQNPRHIFILEHVQSANDTWLHAIERAAAGDLRDPDSAARQPLEHCLFFFLAHRSCETLPIAPSSGPSTGQTVVANSLVTELGLPRRLAWIAHSIHLLRMPSRQSIAEVVLLQFEAEAQRYQVGLEHVSPEVVAHEVALVEQAGGFQFLPARAARRLRQPIYQALASGLRQVRLDGALERVA